MRTAFDFSPLFRSTVGFDRMMNLLESAGRLGEDAGYPPYNIEKVGEDAYRITLAVAGFKQDDLTIVTQENSLLVTGKQQGNGNGQYLHRGIAARAFERRFELADHIRVVGAGLDNGLLSIELVREVPEAKKPRNVSISTGTPSQTIEHKAAA